MTRRASDGKAGRVHHEDIVGRILIAGEAKLEVQLTTMLQRTSSLKSPRNNFLKG